jgi:tetratricopeptide (TPR) repeat protein
MSLIGSNIAFYIWLLALYLAPCHLPSSASQNYRTQGSPTAEQSSTLPNMPSSQEQFDEAMFQFSTGNTEAAIAQLKAILAEAPDYFDAQLALGAAYYAKGDYAAAIVEGHAAEKMKPLDQMVHTNLSRAYMKAGDKATAEHHALQARIASWRGNMAAPSSQPAPEPGLELAKPSAPKPPVKFPDMPWKKK